MANLVIDIDPYADPRRDAIMKFRLTYAAPLFCSGNDARQKEADHKHDLRLAFHSQPKQLWDTAPPLKRNPLQFPDLVVVTT